VPHGATRRGELPVPGRVPFNDLSRAVRRDRRLLDEAIGRVLSSGWYVMGREHDAFEAELAEYLGVAHCIGVASGTDALELALVAAELAPGDEVVTVANAGGYSAVAALRAGLVPAYVDIDDETLQMSPKQLERGLTDRTRAVVLTHLYGLMAPVQQVRELCDAAGVILVEDCAQAAGARTLDGRPAGSFGHLAAFSFYPTKNLAALGDGGAVVTNDDQLAERLRRLRQYGWVQRYVMEVPGGRNSRLDEVQAAVLRTRLPRLDADNARRRSIVARYAAAAPADVRVLFQDDETYVGHLAVAVVSGRRDVLAQRLSERGIATAVHYPVPDHRQGVVARLLALDPDLPATEQACDQVLSLPCFPELTDDEVGQVCDAFHAG
jgi:aminotransferase EvaB